MGNRNKTDFTTKDFITTIKKDFITIRKTKRKMASTTMVFTTTDFTTTKMRTLDFTTIPRRVSTTSKINRTVTNNNKRTSLTNMNTKMSVKPMKSNLLLFDASGFKFSSKLNDLP